jgi:hypothetical protein
MSKLEDWFEIFRSGEHTDSVGSKGVFPERVLDEIILNHENEKFGPAPFVIGHPETDSPAWGWTAGLKKDCTGQVCKLLARGEKLHQAFADGVAAGRWRKNSVRIAQGEDGTWRLVHVGFLGGAPPAIEGMQSAYSKKACKGATHDFLTEEYQSMSDDITAPQEASKVAQFTQADIDAALLKQKADSDKQFAAMQAQIEAERAARVLAEHRQFVGGLIKDDARVTPAQAEGMAEFMLALGGGGQEFSFTANSGKAEKKTGLDWFKAFVAGLPKQLKLGETTGNMPTDKVTEETDLEKHLGKMFAAPAAGGKQ